MKIIQRKDLGPTYPLDILARMIQGRPGKKHCHCSYIQRPDFVKAFCKLTDAELHGNVATLPDGSEVLFGLVGQAFCGYPIDGLFLVDDPFRNKEDVESVAEQDRLEDWISCVVQTRLHPNAELVLAGMVR